MSSVTSVSSLGIFCSIEGTPNSSTFSRSENTFSETDVKSDVLTATDICTFHVVFGFQIQGHVNSKEKELRPQ